MAFSLAYSIGWTVSSLRIRDCTGGISGKTPTPDAVCGHSAEGQIMAKTWKNYPCTFRTRNTINEEGDSTYTINADKAQRHAPVNRGKGRSGKEHSTHTSICYINPNYPFWNVLWTAWAAKRHGKAMKFTVKEVYDDVIFISADANTGMFHRIPQNGYRPFDFNNDDQGVLKNTHIGHEIYGLKAF